MAFALVSSNDQDHMRRFLKNLKNWGVEPEVVVTEGSGLYPALLAELWSQARHQLCIFHVLKDLHKEVLDALRRMQQGLAGGASGGASPDGPPVSRSGGSTVEQISGLPSRSRSQQRVWKRQPEGGFAGHGTSPRKTRRFFRTLGSGSGVAIGGPRCTGGGSPQRAASAEATSTSLPRYITPILSLTYSMTVRLWAMNR